MTSPSALRTYGAWVLSGGAVGLAAALVGSLGQKWIVLAVLLVFSPIVVLLIGSLRSSLLILLVLSLSTAVDVNPWFSDRYEALRPGLPIRFTSLVVLSLFLLLIWDAKRGDTRLQLHGRATLPLLIILFIAALSALKAVDRSFVLYTFPASVEAAAIFLLAANIVRNDGEIRLLVLSSALAITLSSLVALAQYVLGDALDLSVLGGREEVLAQQAGTAILSRVSGFFGHPNTLSFFLNGFLPVILVYGIGSRSLRLKFACLGASVLGLLALVCTLARGGWLSMAGSLVLIAAYFASRGGQRRFPAVWLQLGMLGFVASLCLIPFIPTMVVRLTENDYGTAYSRIPLMLTALTLIAANPLLGVGLGNYKQSVPLYESTWLQDASGQPNYVHNIYLHTAAELGIPALLLFLWVCAMFLRRGLRALRSRDDEVALFSMGLLAGLGAMLAHGMIEPGTFGNIKFVWILFMGGLLVGLSSLSGSGADPSPRSVSAARAPAGPPGRAIALWADRPLPLPGDGGESAAI